MLTFAKAFTLHKFRAITVPIRCTNLEFRLGGSNENEGWRRTGNVFCRGARSGCSNKRIRTRQSPKRSEVRRKDLKYSGEGWKDRQGYDYGAGRKLAKTRNDQLGYQIPDGAQQR